MTTIAELLGQPEIDKLTALRMALGQHQDATAPPVIFSDGEDE